MDNQSVDRAYRIGQKRDVVVYRLITAGTIEEKIYCKQVFKGGLMRAVTEHKDYKKMFNENVRRRPGDPSAFDFVSWGGTLHLGSSSLIWILFCVAFSLKRLNSWFSCIRPWACQAC